ncbi:hypothetical protein [Azospirillum canadense]|uniref:hypothetical protein n=1 Tax=Azospirillum canadense TaxID=403962 RepID=UPI00222664EB|nr:hypothetical protein [Azospirillum canadense]MCW2242496.1 hypothetical protein [Azospirillum canadense]
MAKDRYGCAGHRNKGTCANDRTISRFDVERRVLTGLKERLLAPDLIQEFVDSFRAGGAAATADRAANRRTRERELAAVERKITGVLKAIEDRLYHESMKGRLTGLEADKARLLAEAEETDADLPAVLLHPQLLDLYRRKVEALEAALAEGEDSAEAMEMVRVMIDRIVLTPSLAGAGLDADLHGELAGILVVCEGAAQMRKTQTHERPGSFEPGRQVSVVVGRATAFACCSDRCACLWSVLNAAMLWLNRRATFECSGAVLPLPPADRSAPARSPAARRPACRSAL